MKLLLDLNIFCTLICCILCLIIDNELFFFFFFKKGILRNRASLFFRDLRKNKKNTKHLSFTGFGRWPATRSNAQVIHC